MKTIKKNSDQWNALFRGRDVEDIHTVQESPVDTLYADGDIGHLLDGHTPRVAVIGTRDLSASGRWDCIRIVEALAKNKVKPVIISGLALGADTAAHVAALQAGLPTVAVLPTHPDSIYPYQNTALARKISQTGGCCLLSQFPQGTAPGIPNFLQRNKIIAALADLIIVPEAKAKGGSIFTATYAHFCVYDVPVLAVPGRPDDVRSRGCNELIHNGIAEMLYDFETLGNLF